MGNNESQNFDPNSIVKRSDKAGTGDLFDEVVRRQETLQHQLANKEIKLTKGVVFIFVLMLILFSCALVYYFYKLDNEAQAGIVLNNLFKAINI
jgi:hypothetical protein